MDRLLLHQAWELADQIFRPRATAADREDAHPVADNVRRLGEAGFFGLWVAREFGGLGADEATRHEYTEILASCCGVTAFTQQQLQTGVKFVAEAKNEALQRALLPALAAGRLRCGIALSHLRRSGPPVVRAQRVPGGYRVTGHVPWLTGWGLIDGFVLAAALENGNHLFGYVGLREHADALTASAPMPLAVMRASDTVEVAVHDLFLPDEAVLAVRPPAWLAHEDHRTISAHAALPLGCARACARHLRELAERPGRDALSHTAFALSLEIDQRRRDVLTWNCDCVDHPDYRAHALRARAAAIVLAVRAAHATVVATGGRAHLTGAAPERLGREAQFYATAVQTPEVQASTLDQIFSPLFGL